MIMAAQSQRSVSTAAEARAIRPFRVNFPEADLADLRKRITATKWPEREQVKDATQGVQMATMQKLAQYWANEHDGASVRRRSMRCQISLPRSMGSTFTSFTCVPSMKMRCR